MPNRDRYLELDKGRWRYVRRIPKKVAHLDTRGKIKTALGTASIEIARLRRDAMEEADNSYWASLAEENPDKAQAQYDAARTRAQLLGFAYRPIQTIVDDTPIRELADRILALEGKSGAQLKQDALALLGTAPEPPLSVSKALEMFMGKVAGDDLRGKSPKQVADYRKVKTRAVKNFIALCGDMDMRAIERDHALRFYDWWASRIKGDGDRKGLSGNSGNRDLGNMRRIYKEVFKRLGERDRQNPFDGLSFADPKRLQETPPPFPVAWIKDKLLVVESYAALRANTKGLNPEALGILLAVIETGCRPSELCNIVGPRIHLDHAIPHIRVDYDSNREIKTASSVRSIPLVGVALEVFKKFPNGFPRYRDKETSFSAIALKHLRTRELLPTPKHVVYSLRHSFEDRLKEADVGDEMRRILMGHTVDRAEYGEGGSLEYRQKLLKKIELPYDQALAELLNPSRSGPKASPRAKAIQ